MKASDLISLCALVGPTLAASIPSAGPRTPGRAPDPTNGYITYRGPIRPGGEDHVINGSAHTILEQIKALNPSFNPMDWSHLREAKANLAQKRYTHLKTRSKEGATNCGGYGYAFEDSGLIGPVQDLPGNCEIGPKACEQLTCYMEGGQPNALTFCNDNDHSIAPNCNYLASYGTDIGETCGGSAGEDPPGAFLILAGGQEFDTDGYNVIMGRPDSCMNPIAGGGSPTGS